MVDFPAPKITIGGVPIDEQNFSWMLTAGVLPHYADFIVRKGPRSEQIAELANPTYLEVEVFGGINGTPELSVLRFEKIYIQQPKEIDDFWVQWQIADVRWSFRGRKITKSWNKTRQQNEFGLTSSSPSTDPAFLREQFDKFKTGRYIPWSVKVDGSAYTVYEMLIEVFDELGISYTLDPDGINKSYIEENIEYHSVDVYKVLADLCSMSRLNIGIEENGDLYAYSVDIFDENPQLALATEQNKSKTGPGKIYRQDLKRIRPSRITVRFEKKQEVRLIATPALVESISNPNPIRTPITLSRLQESGLSFSDFENRKVIGCINVIRVPFPVSIAGRNYNIGEFAAFDEYIQALNIEEEDIQKFWFSDMLAFYIDLQLQGAGGASLEVDLTARQIASAIKNSYRQLYMIDPYFMDEVEKWEAQRCTVIDNYSKTSPPSPLWADYAIIPNTRPPKFARNIDLWSVRSQNWLVNDYDPNREKPTPGTISMVNQPLGVFRVNYPVDVDRVVNRIVPSAIDNPAQITPAADRQIFKQTKLAPKHTLETLISVVFATDSTRNFSGSSKYISFPYEFTNFGPALGPEIEFLNKRDYARIPSPSADVQDDAVYNYDILSAIAQSASARVIYQFQDRIVGAVKIAGFQTDIRIDGNIKSIAYTFDSNQGANTVVDMREIPPEPTLEQMVDQQTIAYLHRQITRGGESSVT